MATQAGRDSYVPDSMSASDVGDVGPSRRDTQQKPILSFVIQRTLSSASLWEKTRLFVCGTSLAERQSQEATKITIYTKPIPNYLVAANE